MWRTEWRLQIGAARSWLLLGVLVAAEVVLILFLESMSRASIIPMRGLDILIIVHRAVLRLLLPAVLLVDSLHWNGRGFRDGTLCLGLFANRPRRALFSARLTLLFGRFLASWLLLVAVALSLVLAFDRAPYPLLDRTLVLPAQLARAGLAYAHDLSISWMWLGASFVVVVALHGRRFESSLVCWLLFGLLELLSSNAGAFGVLGGNMDAAFAAIDMDGPIRASLAASFGVPLAAGACALITGQALVRRMDLPPADARQ